jgi:hypothetical protein
MSIWTMVVREAAYHRLGFLLALVSVSAAVASLVGALTLLDLHDAHTEQLLAGRAAETQAMMDAVRRDVKKAMHRLGYNAIILPKAQSLGDWYADDYAVETFPETEAAKLRTTRELCERYLPRLRQKVRWEEQKWTVMVAGVGEEHILETAVSEADPLVKAPPPGACALGYELHHALGIEPGGQITIRGRTIPVARCEPEQGTKDDITIWLSLADAQALLNRPGRINEILIVEHLSVWGNLKEVRRRVEAVLPACQVVEIASETMARTHARRKVAEEAAAAMQRQREKRAALKAQMARNAWIVVPLVLLLCGVWIGLLMYGNVRDRAGEMGTLMALGFRPRTLQAIVLSKAALIGTIGAVAGFVLGRAGAGLWRSPDAALASWSGTGMWAHLTAALGVAFTICLLASWLPARAVSLLDPADVLRGD